MAHSQPGVSCLEVDDRAAVRRNHRQCLEPRDATDGVEPDLGILVIDVLLKIDRDAFEFFVTPRKTVAGAE